MSNQKVIQPRNDSRKVTEETLIHHALCRRIIGATYDVFKALNFGYQEKQYQRAVATRFDELGINYRRELHLPLRYHDRIIGRYFVDFVVDQAVVLELKVANDVYDTHVNQVLGYLKSSGLEVGLLALFTQSGVRIKRIIASKHFPRISANHSVVVSP